MPTDPLPIRHADWLQSPTLGWHDAHTIPHGPSPADPVLVKAWSRRTNQLFVAVAVWSELHGQFLTFNGVQYAALTARIVEWMPLPPEWPRHPGPTLPGPALPG